MRAVTTLKSLLFLSAAAAAFAAPGAQAQTTKPTEAPVEVAAAEPAADDTVIVTARRRSETLYDTPAAVTVLSGEMLRDSNITDVRDIMNLIPNAQLGSTHDRFNSYITIRGMRKVDVQAEPNFGIFRNGMYNGGHRTNLGPQVDIKRIEVLRGPQGGLYGRNAVGGAVNVIFNTPTDEFEGYVKATYGSYDEIKLEGMVNTPIDDMFSVRLTSWYQNQTGSELFNETLQQKVEAYNEKGVRASLQADSGKWTVLWMAEWHDGWGPSLRTFAPIGVVNGSQRSLPETFNLNRQNTPSRQDTEETYVMQKVSYESSIGTFEANISFRNYDLFSVIDSDQTPLGPVAPNVLKTAQYRDESTNGYFVEGVWTSPSDQPFTWILGVSYFDEDFDFARTLTSQRNLTGGFGFREVEIGFPNKGTVIGTESLAAFAQASYQVTDDFSVTAGVRWSHDHKTLHYSQGPVYNGTPALNAALRTALNNAYPTFALDLASDFYNTSPSLTLKYDISENVNVYASYTTGFRPGAFNVSPVDLATIPYGQEDADQYEVGLKSLWFDRKLSVNLAAFYMRQTNALLSQTVLVEGIQRSYYINVGTANTYGVELEASGKIFPWLMANFSVGWISPYYDYAVNSGQDLSGLLIPNIRKWTANLRFDVNTPINENLDFVGSASFRYEAGGLIGDYFRIDPYSTMNKLDLSAGVVIGEKTRIVAQVDNVLDEHISMFFYGSGATSVTQGRTYALSISYEF
ncbi:Vitamin B12 transporter BtuB [Alphaproteobacteria bacterium SO-S41]|nr:Vitamin B12 transporter BtuB [Alphaproteobacteria bacterium SO-S41]